MTLVADIKSRVTLRDTAAMLGLAVPQRAGLKFRSPLRPDKNPSCSIYQRADEWRFRDWSHGIDVDQIGFYALARGISNTEAIHELAQRLNLTNDGALNPEIAAASKLARAVGTTKCDRPAAIPVRVAEAWREGVEYLRKHPRWQPRIAKWRGWTAALVDQLVEDGMMGTPLYNGDRLVAFRVDYPLVQDFGPFGTWFSADQIGFHVRLKPASAGEKPSWRFCPNEREHGQSIPSLPFILGEFTAARLLVIMEGQWDAISFAHAAGWLVHDAAWPDWVCVIGIRGTHGIRPFLTHYAAHWPRKAKCLLLADNDRAGATWFESAEGQQSFADRLIHFCTEVHVETISGAKDFNEAWQRGLVTACDIGRQFIANGFTNEEGQLLWRS
jgi:hypothetical protein